MTASCGAVAIIKIGKHFSRLRALIEKLNLLPQAMYVERATLTEGRCLPLADVAGNDAPYFSIILIYKGGEDWAGLAGAARGSRL